MGLTVGYSTLHHLSTLQSNRLRRSKSQVFLSLKSSVSRDRLSIAGDLVEGVKQVFNGHGAARSLQRSWESLLGRCNQSAMKLGRRFRVRTYGEKRERGYIVARVGSGLRGPQGTESVDSPCSNESLEACSDAKNVPGEKPKARLRNRKSPPNGAM